MNKFSNILKVNPNSDLYLNFMNEISTKINSIDNKANIPLSDRSLNKMKFDSETLNTNMEIEKKFIVLPELRNKNSENIPIKIVEEITDQDTKVILNLKIIDIIPRNVNDFTYAYCQENQERYISNLIYLYLFI
jgi:hypothetical protein